MTIAITPRTERGTGFVLPVGKAIAHLLVVVNAITREWPMTIEEAAAELNETAEHLNDLNFNRDLISTDTNAAIDAWRDQIREALATVQANALSAPDGSLAEVAPRLAQIATDTWTLLTVIDRELTGLSDAATDPGHRP
jgi:hypothetical protein